MPKPGQFILHSRVLPTLTAGPYTFHFEQAMNASLAHVDPLDAHVEVTAPRFALPADQILSTFPPNQATGAFSSRLPQIVLRRRTLPWEREVFPGHPEVPWLALVVLEEGVGEFKAGVPVAQCVTQGVTMPPGRNDVTVADSLTVSLRTLTDVFPTLKDLTLLAHVREVDLADTELALGDDDGWLAVIVANRLPQPDTRYVAYLISIEGQANNAQFLASFPDTDQPSGPLFPGGEFPRLTFPVLAHWSFTCAGAGDFQSLMQGLDVGLLGELAAPKPATGAKPPPPPARPAPEVDEKGLVGLDYTTRDGDPARVWYRGPLVPQPGTRQAPGPDGRLPLLHTSEQARRVEPDGRENLSLATAFEIGRLLALAEPSVVAALLLWRRDGFAQARSAALLARDPGLSELAPDDVGRGFAARAGLTLLTSLGADGARRLGPARALVTPGVPIPELDEEDPIDVVAAGFGVDRELLEAVLTAAPAAMATLTGGPAPRAFDQLAAQADAALARLRPDEEVTS